MRPVVIAGGMDDADARVAAGPGVPPRRRHQRPRGGAGPHRLDAQLRDRPADPARRGGPRGRGADGPRRDGRGPAARARRRGHRHAGGQLPEARPDLAATGWRCSRRSPTTRRSRSRTRTCSPGSRRPRRASAASSRRRRRDLAQRRRGPVHVHGRGRGAAVRLDARTTSSAATSPTSSPRSRMPTRATPGSAWPRPRVRSWRLRFVLVRKDGTRLPGRGVRGHELRRHGEFRGAQGTLRDISERERLERELQLLRGALPRPRPVARRT